MENTLDDELEILEKEWVIMFKDADFDKNVTTRDTESLDKLYQQYHGSDRDMFMVIGDANGSIIYKSSAYPLSTFDIGAVARGNTVNGIVQKDGEMVAMYACPASLDGESYAVCLGFTMEATDWLQTVKSRVDCEVTIINNNVRYATTLSQALVGTTIPSDIESTVVRGQQNHSGQQVIDGTEYYTSYEPMKDYQGNVVGAFFAGSDATDANAEFGSVTAMAIIIGVVGALGIALFIFIFCRTRVTVPLANGRIRE